MSNRTTINVSKEAHRVASEAKRDNETWGDYLRRCAEAPTDETAVDSDALAEALAEQLDAIADSASMVADPAAPGDGVTEEIIGRIDDLEARLPRKVAEELGGGR